MVAGNHHEALQTALVVGVTPGLGCSAGGHCPWGGCWPFPTEQVWRGGQGALRRREVGEPRAKAHKLQLCLSHPREGHHRPRGREPERHIHQGTPSPWPCDWPSPSPRELVHTVLSVNSETPTTSLSQLSKTQTATGSGNGAREPRSNVGVCLAPGQQALRSAWGDAFPCGKQRLSWFPG